MLDGGAALKRKKEKSVSRLSSNMKDLDGSKVFLNKINFFFVFCLFWAAPVAYGGSQARGLIRATAAGLRHSHSSVGSKPRLPPTLGACGHTGSLTH